MEICLVVELGVRADGSSRPRRSC